MNLFFSTPKPVLKKIWRKYRAELILITLSLVISTISLGFYAYTQAQENYSTPIEEEESSQNISPQKIFVDISGAVNKPNVYELSFGARVRDVIKLSGGLSRDADLAYFTRNLNLARIMNDQEKIYIPTTWEINSGIFIENIRSINNNEPNLPQESTNLNTDLININGASSQELDRLPGVGQVTADKIINSRPYNSTEELVSKKIVNKSVFEKIKLLITLN